MPNSETQTIKKINEVKIGKWTITVDKDKNLTMTRDNGEVLTMYHPDNH